MLDFFKKRRRAELRKQPLSAEDRATLGEKGGEQVDVEMQSQRRPALRARALYYWARLYTGQLQRGHPYTALRRCVVVLVTNFAELTSQRFHSIFSRSRRSSATPKAVPLRDCLVTIKHLT